MNRIELDVYTIAGERGPATYDEISRWASREHEVHARDLAQCLTHLAVIGKITVDYQGLYSYVA
jgi:hypothetical protein